MRCNLILASLIAFALCGCAGMADGMSKVAGLGVVKQETSTFDNAAVVTASPTFLYGKGWPGNRVKLGARWTSASPDRVALVLAYDSNVTGYGDAYMNLTGIDINIDGEISSHAANAPTALDSSGYNSVSRTIYTSSRNAVVIPYALLERMVAAKDCRIRIHTGKGYEDAQFSVERIPGGQGTAILAIREFLAKVSVVR
ncbi:hypothetical protein H9L17_03805 [Thermomonas brevis]|uniref:Lipoprotein n=1 Tax=Thermomonas brevis TaxID=215691 RepID=A0A7G9QVB1_9GAMM|nr:hypothetical protein [Thermomonas brevis]QNN47286.1 hypothetical protein H9L17_03805 [Thermomonas brevis]